MSTHFKENVTIVKRCIAPITLFIESECSKASKLELSGKLCTEKFSSN